MIDKGEFSLHVNSEKNITNKIRKIINSIIIYKVRWTDGLENK